MGNNLLRECFSALVQAHWETLQQEGNFHAQQQPDHMPWLLGATTETGPPISTGDVAQSLCQVCYCEYQRADLLINIQHYLGTARRPENVRGLQRAVTRSFARTCHPERAITFLFTIAVILNDPLLGSPELAAMAEAIEDGSWPKVN